MKKLSGALLALGLFVLAGCVSTGKTPQETSYTLYRDLPYGPHERNLVDLSIPNGASLGGAPEGGTILWIHGGIWMYGGKENCPVFLDGFRDRFIVASMNHRYIDETTHIDDLMEDVAAALSAIKEFALQNRKDPGKLIIMGHSSGAHLAMLYAYKHRETSPIPPAFCVDMAGPADLGDIAFLYNFKKLGWEKIFYGLAEKAAGHHIVDGDITGEGYSETGKQILAAISPLTFVSADSPPTIIVHDAADTIVPYANSAALNSVFNVYGIDHYFMASSSGIGHVLGAKTKKGGALAYNKALEAWLLRVMNEYIEKYSVQSRDSRE
ncbi:MAG: alpha/beta hydrolase [Spirochaetaceae bacterium]|nr:alpha/beta hydrolase [Spirochaetaceae bacterium]